MQGRDDAENACISFSASHGLVSFIYRIVPGADCTAPWGGAVVPGAGVVPGTGAGAYGLVCGNGAGAGLVPGIGVGAGARWGMAGGTLWRWGWAGAAGAGLLVGAGCGAGPQAVANEAIPLQTRSAATKVPLRK